MPEDTELKDLVMQSECQHPAIARLRSQLVASSWERITSYDRMHHRHSRSSDPKPKKRTPKEEPPDLPPTEEVEGANCTKQA